VITNILELKSRVDVYANYVLLTQPLFVTGDPGFQVSRLMYIYIYIYIYISLFQKEIQQANVSE
jgi:hypothetical protein